ncbi:N-acetyltransferase [Nocardioides mangrovicus]|uniref:N-acetyltransferase n=1 Tax=Nocardioides mangrovicus TaxID=2478913 RepID=A0A3L8P1K3_9ACTN|nr:GNAT family N-acetyltransferase [Nocardioides mangrovicus]RLV48298.1 N-acetyltransferase [Nocardioides mangrovicus]
MPELVSREVTAADDAWIYVPDDAETTHTGDYLLVYYPTYWAGPTQVVQTHSERPAAELVAEVLAQVRDHGRSDVVWWVRDGLHPDGLEQHLVGAGARRDETLTVLAKALDQPIPPAPGEPEVRAVADLATLQDDHRVGVAAFEEQMPSEAELQAELERLVGSNLTQTRLVAYLDGVPVGMGGARIADGAVRLWGGGTVPEYRRRGVYAAVLRARLNWALEQGARFALTRGRVETSAPILRREGFGVFGERRSYRLNA